MKASPFFESRLTPLARSHQVSLEGAKGFSCDACPYMGGGRSGLVSLIASLFGTELATLVASAFETSSWSLTEVRSFTFACCELKWFTLASALATIVRVPGEIKSSAISDSTGRVAEGLGGRPLELDSCWLKRTSLQAKAGSADCSANTIVPGGDTSD